MNGTAKLIMWIGLFLIAMIVVAHWKEIRATLFTSPSAGGVPPLGTTKPVKGKCPPGYGLRNGTCFPPVASGPPLAA